MANLTITLSSPDRIARRTGLAAVFLSALLFSTAGLFSKGAATDAWSVLFWRGLSSALVVFIFLIAKADLRRQIRPFAGRNWRPAWLAVAICTSGSAAFVPAFKLTSIANVVLIYAAAPFVAALLAWLALRERPAARVMLASMAALAGIAVIVGGSASLSATGLLGDGLALWMTMMMAAVMVLYRRWPDTPTATPTALSSLAIVGLASIFSDPLAASIDAIALSLAFGFVFATASILLMEGSKHLPSSETALISIFETPLAPFWAWLILSETPSGVTVIGGAMILAAILASQVKRP
ncbi:MAG: DMT family transporter [Alphaproteobacteria bacterium]|nr:DMT family transporter [Alphaproteobacteria bacterium]